MDRASPKWVKDSRVRSGQVGDGLGLTLTLVPGPRPELGSRLAKPGLDREGAVKDWAGLGNQHRHASNPPILGSHLATLSDKHPIKVPIKLNAGKSFIVGHVKCLEKFVVS